MHSLALFRFTADDITDSGEHPLAHSPPKRPLALDFAFNHSQGQHTPTLSDLPQDKSPVKPEKHLPSQPYGYSRPRIPSLEVPGAMQMATERTVSPSGRRRRAPPLYSNGTHRSARADSTSSLGPDENRPNLMTEGLGDFGALVEVDGSTKPVTPIPPLPQKQSKKISNEDDGSSGDAYVVMKPGVSTPKSPHDGSQTPPRSQTLSGASGFASASAAAEDHHTEETANGEPSSPASGRRQAATLLSKSPGNVLTDGVELRRSYTMDATATMGATTTRRRKIPKNPLGRSPSMDMIRPVRFQALDRSAGASTRPVFVITNESAESVPD